MSNVLAYNPKVTIDGVDFNCLTAISPETSDETSSVQTSDGNIQVGAPKGGTEVQLEGVELPRDKAHRLAQKKIMDRGIFDGGSITGTALYKDGTEYELTFVLLGGTISKNWNWSPTDQTQNTITIKSDIEELE